MTLSLMFVLILLGTTSFLALPVLLKKESKQTSAREETVIYQEQLAEVEKELGNGLLTTEQALDIRLEIQRRLLLTSPAQNAAADSRAQRLGLITFILLVIPLSTMVLYTYLGSPELPAKPYASRSKDEDFILGKEAEQLSEKLAQSPDPNGYQHLADLYFSLRWYHQAIDSYERIIEINGGNPGVWAGLGEALTLAHDGAVTQDAEIAFSQALRMNPADARSQFYLGIAAKQKSLFQDAVAIWLDLQKKNSPDAPWQGLLRKEIDEASREGHFTSASIVPHPPTLAPIPKSRESVVGTVISSDEAAAILNMSPEERNAIIHKMVDQLADQMIKNPDDLEGWKRLAQAYRVIGEKEKAAIIDQKIKDLLAKKTQP